MTADLPAPSAPTRNPARGRFPSISESLRPTNLSTPAERVRWRIVAIALSIAVIIGALGRFIASEGYLGSSFWAPFWFVMLAVAVLISVPNKPNLNKIAAAIGVLGVIACGGDLITHVSSEWFGVMKWIAAAHASSEIEMLVLTLISAAVATMSSTHPRRVVIGIAAQTLAWALVVTGLVLFSYNIGSTVFPPFLAQHAISLTSALSGAGILLALGAARPDRAPLAAPVMGKGIGLVPVTVGLMIFVPAFVRTASTLLHGGEATPYSSTGALLISILLMVLSMVYIDSRRIHVEQTREADQIKSAEAMAMRAKHDQLTGLPNRNEALSILTDALTHATEDHPVTILWCDVDNFRQINDGISHEAGDEILVQIGTLLTTRVPVYATVARMGSDEFLIILPDADGETGLSIAEDLIKVISKEPFGVNYNVMIGLTIGVAESTKPMQGSVLVSHADVALTRGKSLHRGYATVFTEEMLQNIAERMEMAQGLREGIDKREFHAWGQPIVRLSTGEIVGYESLARWIKPDGTVVPAYQWVDVAESHGLMVAIGDLVIEDALAAATRLPEDLYVTVNASGRQLLQPGFAKHLIEHLERNNLDPHRIIVEVTEATIIDVQSTDRIKKVLDAITAHGMRIYLDDFGTGYSAVSHLSDFPVAGLKLDKSFTDLLTTGDHHDYQLAQGVAKLAASLELHQVAEGVETQDQADLLLQAGWECGQGWLFGKPAPYPADYPPEADVA